MATQTKKRKKKTTTKKKKMQQPDYTINFVGFLFILISLFSGLKLGFIGALFANVFRLSLVTHLSWAQFYLQCSVFTS